MQIIYFLICFIQPIFLPTPEALTVVGGSATLGAFQGFIIAFIGTVLGILTMYLLSRKYGMKIVNKLVRQKDLDRYTDYVKKNQILFSILLFIIPILPDEVICIGAGISGISLNVFLIIAIISKFFTTFTYSYSLNIFSYFNIGFTEILIALIIIFIIVTLYKYIKKVACSN